MIVETNQLTKRFQSQTAVDSLNMHIEKGDIYGLVGKNGAGKTTLMKMIAGVSIPSGGSLKLFDSENRKDSKQKIGTLIEQPSLFMNESARENVRRYAIVSGVKGDLNQEVERVLKLVNLTGTGNKKAKNFSVGMKQRLGIAIALLGNPEFLILDEPTNGLDPVGIKEIRELMNNLKNKGITVFISSHILDELAKIATRYGVMREGRLVQELTADEVTHYCQNAFQIKPQSFRDAIAFLDRQSNTIPYLTENDMIYCYKTDEQQVEALCRSMNEAGIQIIETTKTSITTEQFFTNEVG
ncbi:MAG: ABC transporter ATP-binding protein [Oscillospiraceae bacterium]|nr:ABC transporter ATP-binding protein [Oscillospiraceae bacterium]